MTAVGDIGVPIEITVVRKGAVLDISFAAGNTIEMFFRDKEGTTVTKTGTLPGGGTDGVIRYLTEGGFPTLKGAWEVQGHLAGGGNDIRTEIGTFEVVEALDA